MASFNLCSQPHLAGQGLIVIVVVVVVIISFYDIATEKLQIKSSFMH